MKKKLNVNFLREECSDIDEFEGGIHRKISEMLYEIISESKNGGYTIGLEGDWGCGKSTIVHLLEKKSQETQKLKIFTFDSWAHKNDPLHIAFLSQLIIGLLKEKSKLLDEVRYKKQRTHYKIGIFGIFVTIFTLLFSIALAIIGNSEFRADHYIFLYNKGFDLAVDIIWVVSCLVFLLFVLKRAHIISESGVVAFDKDVYEELQFCDKDSYEFKKLYDKILQKVFEKDQRKLVIVLDNLDRLGKERVLEIMSSMQLFLKIDDKIKDKVWFLIPYSKEFFNSQSKDISNVFFEKCFQLRLDVPSPSLVTWEKFFQKQWSLVGKEFSEKDKMCVLKIFQLLNVEQDEGCLPNYNVTPRRIKNYINQLIAYRRLYPQFKIESVCRFVFWRYINNECIENIKFRLFSDLPENIKAEISGIIFGTSAKTGMELLLLDKCVSLINEQKWDELPKMKKLYPDIFANMCEQFFLKYSIPDTFIPEICYFYYQVSEFVYDVIRDAFRNRLKLSIKNSINGISSFRSRDAKIYVSFAKFLNDCHNKTLRKQVIRQCDVLWQRNIDGDNYIEGFILTFLDEKEVVSNISEYTKEKLKKFKRLHENVLKFL